MPKFRSIEMLPIRLSDDFVEEIAQQFHSTNGNNYLPAAFLSMNLLRWYVNACEDVIEEAIRSNRPIHIIGRAVRLPERVVASSNA